MNSQTPDPAPEHYSDPDRTTGPDGLLSAYLDGELTSEENAEVEAHLESSESARRSLEELRSLSHFLTNLKPEPAPETLRASLPTTPQQTPQPRRRPSIAVISTLVAVAALVIVAVIPQTSLWSPSRTSDEGADLAATGPAEGLPESNLSSEPGAGAGPPGGGLSAATMITEDGRLVFDNTPDKAEVGQILSAIDTSGGQAVVVRLTVVDVQQGLDSLRLLLQKHQIASADLPAEAVDRSVNRRSPVPTSPPGGGQLVSVVVQASSEQVSEAMASLRREVASEMELAGVLHVAALETAPGGRRALAQLQSFRGIKPRARFATPAAPLADKPNADEGSRKLAAKSKAPTRKRPVLASAQVRLDLPKELMKQVNRARSESRPSTTSRDVPARPLQIVFVLVGGPRPAVPPNPDPDGAA